MCLCKNLRSVVVFLLTVFTVAFSTSGCNGYTAQSASQPSMPLTTQLSVSPDSISVSSTVGTMSSQTVAVSNTGAASVMISDVTVTGTGFSVSGLTLPVTLGAKQSQNFTVEFSATASGNVTGALSITTSASASPVVIPLHGTSSDPETQAVTSVVISPSTASSVTGGTLPFTATVGGTASDKTVTWKASRGTMTTAGVYTAPATAGSDTVTATSHADATKSDTAAVTVSAPVVSSVSITPASASTTPNSSMQFNAAVAGTVTNKSVTWKALRGTVTTAGTYTAPASTGSDTVTATSVADTSKSASATVTVATTTAIGAAGRLSRCAGWRSCLRWRTRRQGHGSHQPAGLGHGQPARLCGSQWRTDLRFPGGGNYPPEVTHESFQSVSDHRRANGTGQRHRIARRRHRKRRDVLYFHA